MPEKCWNIRKQKIGNFNHYFPFVKTFITRFVNKLFNHKSTYLEKESISTNIFSFLSFEITSAIFSLCPPDVPTRNVSPNFTIDYRIQIEFDGCGDDQKLGDVQFPSQRHGTTLQTAQRQFIAPC